MKKFFFGIYFLFSFRNYYYSNLIENNAESFREYSSALSCFQEILEECREQHLIRKSFICYAKHNLFYEEYLAATKPSYLEQLILKFRYILNSFKESPSATNAHYLEKTSLTLKMKCYIEMDYIIKRFR